jgi:2-aminoadipate transaminase
MRVLRDTPREALQYAASGGSVRCAMGRRQMARQGCGEPGAGADHDRLAARPRPRRQVPIDAGSRVAVESLTYLGALQAFVPYSLSSSSRRRRRRVAADALASSAAGARLPRAAQLQNKRSLISAAAREPPAQRERRRADRRG